MELRRVEVLRNGEWAKTEMRKLAVGDEFRMFQGGVQWEYNGKKTWVTESKPYTIDKGIWAVEVLQ